jgi:hypothetical protein
MVLFWDVGEFECGCGIFWNVQDKAALGILSI